MQLINLHDHLLLQIDLIYIHTHIHKILTNPYQKKKILESVINSHQTN